MTNENQQKQALTHYKGDEFYNKSNMCNLPARSLL